MVPSYVKNERKKISSDGKLGALRCHCGSAE